MASEVFFYEMIEGETLEKFLDRVVRPDTTFLSQSNQVIDTVVRLLHKEIPYSVSQIIKGGSLGKGTGVRNKSDVDLLVVLNNFSSIDELKNNLPSILITIKDTLQNKLSNYLPGAQILISGRTPFTLQFRLKCDDTHEWFDVDLLPIIDVWSNWFILFDGKRSTYDKMKSEPYLQGYYAKCLAKLQVDFVKPLPAKAKDLIRLLKYWNKIENVGLSSYGVELLVIYVWENGGRKQNFTLKSLMAAVVKELVNYTKLEICWNINYGSKRYCTSLSLPYILDPANPFNNLAPHDWSFWGESTIERKARELERKLKGLPEEKSSWLWYIGLGAIAVVSILAKRY